MKKILAGVSLVKRTPKEKVKKVHEMKTFDEVGKQSIEDIYFEIKEFNKEANGFFKVDTDSKRLVMQQAQPAIHFQSSTALQHLLSKITSFPARCIPHQNGAHSIILISFLMGNSSYEKTHNFPTFNHVLFWTCNAHVALLQSAREIRIAGAIEFILLSREQEEY